MADEPITSTRDQLLDAAVAMLQRVGFVSFSFRDLAAQVGIRSASIHYHFPTKADLGLALVARARQRRQEHEQQLAADYPDEGDRLLAVGRLISSLFCDRGCSSPVFILQAEFPVLPPPVQEAVRAWVAEKLDLITRWLDEGRRAGRLRFPGTTQSQARLVWATMEYGAHLCRIQPHESFQAIVDQLVATMRPAPTPSSRSSSRLRTSNPR